MKTRYLALFLVIGALQWVYAQNNQQFHTLEAITNHGTFYYKVDNSGDTNVASDLQKIFDELSLLTVVSATLIFSPASIRPANCRA